LPDGTTLHLTLLGPPLPGLDARERVAWGSVTTRFRPRTAVPRAIQAAGRLHLVAGTVVLTLGLPPCSTLESQVIDRAPLRSAHLYSLVVNAFGETCAEILTIHDIDGRPVIRQSPCSIEIVHEGSASRTPPRRREAMNLARSTCPGRHEDPVPPVQCRVPEDQNDHDDTRPV